jgi:hypothetical protein
MRRLRVLRKADTIPPRRRTILTITCKGYRLASDGRRGTIVSIALNDAAALPSGGNMASNDDSDLTDAEAKLLAPVPMGAAWLAGTAVALLLIAWFLIWLLIYLPRGPIG